MCNNNGFGGCGCLWILIIIILLFSCGGNCGCSNNCVNNNCVC